ncbi:DNA methyltransferase [Desulfuromonas acetexigens]|uniref:Site-specific DNA-methyltransferase n=1 Tax=Trichloromonas acetexigens TaxID=38815 RepID=A0A550J4Z5_9BACT|nr:DNA methyltransferase [Desulfuromonas acetexigens]TRO78309.1 site-specific DNA-methyltransferase [Desulfuromonas acetexigens]
MKQDELFNSEHRTQNTEPQPVTCLGIEFPSDEARRQHFTELLRDRLRNPEFRKIEGFPIGSDEDILNLSDPPYYTACPNPWIADFIAEWEAQKPEQPEGYHYHREPFAADVSEGKYDPLYKMHPYHTKVPHKAIMRYLLRYTQPGDIVFDGFCGTGMTGVASQLCGDRDEVISLGYQVKPDGIILQEEIDENGKKVWREFSKLGPRWTIQNDLSPAATFIAYNYNSPINSSAFEKEAKRIIREVEKECGWMYETIHSDGRKGKINYIVWSDVFVCPECANEIVFWHEAVDINGGKVLDEFSCSHCKAALNKRSLDRAWSTIYDESLNDSIRQAKQVPVLINYSVGTTRCQKEPDQSDLIKIEKILKMPLAKWHPTDRMIEGRETRRNDPNGITHVHHFYYKSTLASLATYRSKASSSIYWNILSAVAFRINKRYGLTYQAGVWGAGGGPTSGTLYLPSLVKDLNVIQMLKQALKKHVEAFKSKKQTSIITTQSSTSINMPDCSIDYLFFDPPFGANLNYAELNFIWESWLGVITHREKEAIEDKGQKKDLHDYRVLMTSCFSEAFRVLKPGRWMTVEFSNSKAAVWNAIQNALTDAGFVVANVSVLDKKKGSFISITTTTAVKQDLVISAYKPNGGFEERFQKEAQTEEGVWDFVRTHLQYLPVIKQQGASLQFVSERDPRILFDQMVAYYVRKGYPVPISSQEFQIGLAQRFIERDGMYFLPDQVAEYDRKKMTSGELTQMAMFVCDEASSIQWLRQLIREKPQTFSDINPQFMQQLGGWSKNEAQLDLRELLNQNFLCYDGKGPVPEQIHAYLSTNWKELRNLPKDDPTLVAKARDRWFVPDPNKAGDLEKLREKALLKEFEEYKEVKKKLKVFRLEAVRAGFKKAWQERDYAVIVAVADKIPNNVLEEDPKLLMWYDQAVTRMGGE